MQQSPGLGSRQRQRRGDGIGRTTVSTARPSASASNAPGRGTRVARRVVQQVAALATAMGGLVVTAGIGEHAAPMRARLVEALGWLGLALDVEAHARPGPRVRAATSRVEVRVIPPDEEWIVARQRRAVLADAPRGPA